MSAAPAKSGSGLRRRRRHDPEPTPTTKSTNTVPPALQVTAAYAWRLLVIAGVVAIAVWVIIEFKIVVIPLLIGILLTALTYPAFSAMLRLKVPKIIAVVVSVLGTLAFVAGLIWLVVSQVGREAATVQGRLYARVEDLRAILIDSGIVSSDQLDTFLQDALTWAQQQGNALLTGALAVGSTIGQLSTGLLLTVFVMLCLLFDGAGIWRWTLGLFPKAVRAATNVAAHNGWRTLINYARTQILVATIDAIGIGLGAFFLGVPLAIPIAVFVFLGAFVPFVGAIVTGAIAVLIALIYNGPLIAVLMLAVVLLVQQVESHVLQPMLMGAAVKVHPLAVILVVTAGTTVGGIAGALFAVPVAAFLNVVAVTLSSGSWRTGEQAPQDVMWSTVPKRLGRGGNEDDDEDERTTRVARKTRQAKR